MATKDVLEEVMMRNGSEDVVGGVKKHTLDQAPSNVSLDVRSEDIGE